MKWNIEDWMMLIVLSIIVMFMGWVLVRAYNARPVLEVRTEACAELGRTLEVETRMAGYSCFYRKGERWEQLLF